VADERELESYLDGRDPSGLYSDMQEIGKGYGDGLGFDVAFYFSLLF
jgi:hypothetical protein